MSYYLHATWHTYEMAHIFINLYFRKSIYMKHNFILTQLLTNHGNFRSYLHKINKAPSYFCSCADNVLQTAQHLFKKCTLFSKDQPSEARNLLLHQILKHHINTIFFNKFMESIFSQLQELQDWNYNNTKHTNTVNLPWYTSWWNTGCTFYFVNKKRWSRELGKISAECYLISQFQIISLAGFRCIK